MCGNGEKNHNVWCGYIGDIGFAEFSIGELAELDTSCECVGGVAVCVSLSI